ncbi:MAG: hypothetical protein GF393_12080, partial [Armatimonadia bacterium]|nr:hypothetical protein [Armatimonadia bacterium]
MRSPSTAITMVLVLLALTVVPVLAQKAAAQRMSLLRDNADANLLSKGLSGSDLLVARTAARLLPAHGAEARGAVSKALRH